MKTAKKGIKPLVEVIPIEAGEKALIALVIQKDQDAFKRLYQQHLSSVYTLCFRLTGNKNQAEEATQEVFLKVWHKIESYSGASSFSTWLHSLTRNTTISYLRRQKSWKQRFTFHEEANIDLENESSEAQPDLAELDQLISKLPERARMVFVLHAIEGLRHEDIAKSLSINIGTSKAHFNRAKTFITHWLEEHK